jgi:hypothetical protein
VELGKIINLKTVNPNKKSFSKKIIFMGSICLLILLRSSLSIRFDLQSILIFLFISFPLCKFIHHHNQFSILLIAFTIFLKLSHLHQSFFSLKFECIWIGQDLTGKKWIQENFFWIGLEVVFEVFFDSFYPLVVNQF